MISVAEVLGADNQLTRNCIKFLNRSFFEIQQPVLILEKPWFN